MAVRQTHKQRNGQYDEPIDLLTDHRDKQTDMCDQ